MQIPRVEIKKILYATDLSSEAGPTRFVLQICSRLGNLLAH